MTGWCLGIDLGGTHLRLRAVRRGETGELVQTEPYRLRWRVDGADASVDGLVAAVAQASRDAAQLWFGAPDTTWGAVGFAVAAQLGPDGRTVANAPNLGWRNEPLADLTAAALGLAADRVRLLNDLKAIVNGELLLGAARGAPSLFAMYAGTGVGGAFAIGPRVWTGAGGNAGEIGHVKVAGVTALCGCGQRGCMESVAGGAAIERRVLADVAAGLTAPLGDEAPLTAVEARYVRGETWAVALWTEVSHALSHGLSSAITLFNPAVVLTGGGVLDHAPSLHSLVLRKTLELTLEVSAANVRFITGQLADHAGCTGAAAFVLSHRLEET